MNQTIETSTSIAVKICGITNAKQALEIADLGVKAIGVIGVKESKRYVEGNRRREIFDQLSIHFPRVERVWVVADCKKIKIERAINEKGCPNVIQLHGSETHEECAELRAINHAVKIWKAIRIKEENDLRIAQTYQNYVDALLLDSWDEKKIGGTGKCIDPKILLSTDFKIPWWLAGGISKQAINKFLKNLSPYGIDVSSKVEISPGIKNISEIKVLIDYLSKL
tara:strand:- start:70 stop:741 length:672 start_codon:yes stop_codon:yes gene_type:complete